MSYSNQTIPTPVTATLELHNTLRATYHSFFTDVFTKDQLIADSKQVFSILMNAPDTDGNKLEVLLGTSNAKLCVNQVMFKLLTGSDSVEAE